LQTATQAKEQRIKEIKEAFAGEAARAATEEERKRTMDLGGSVMTDAKRLAEIMGNDGMCWVDRKGDTLWDMALSLCEQCARRCKEPAGRVLACPKHSKRQERSQGSKARLRDHLKGVV